ncbi:MAG: cobyric acid synthase [Rhodospirillaceae bacterium]|nr:cobyric acid synthase [Rhodospirillaceae bacterium]
MAAMMIQGCGSDVGKSVLTAGLCRALTNRGYRVRPFKPQNMSNNAAVTADGGEIGRAQALQAIACRTPATVDMNPVLLKPQSDVGAQVVVRGRIAGTWQARGYQQRKAELLDTVLHSFRALQADSDVVIVEGAGSPAEINLRAHDIANMGFARAAQVPVVLVGDIDRGHVIAALVGAQGVLSPEDNAMIKGFIINKFRGDPTLFDEGRNEIVARTGWCDFGLMPWSRAARQLPAEDAVVLERQSSSSGRQVKIAVPMLSRIANFDDFDPLKMEPDVQLLFVPPGQALPGDADLVILPGTKATVADLKFLRDQGWDIDIAAHVRRGGRVLGLCGGFQMLGSRVSDPTGIEGPGETLPGLSYLDIETVLTPDKMLKPVRGTLAGTSAEMTGYEMHVGRTSGAALSKPFLALTDGPDGAVSDDGRIAGCYVHGLFNHPAARAHILHQLGVASTGAAHDSIIDKLLDDLAAEIEMHLDVPGLMGLAGLK